HASTAAQAQGAPLPAGAPTQIPGSVGPSGGPPHSPSVPRRATTIRVLSTGSASVPIRLLPARSIAARRTTAAAPAAQACRPRQAPVGRVRFLRRPCLFRGGGRAGAGGQVVPTDTVTRPPLRASVRVIVSSAPPMSGGPTTAKVPRRLARPAAAATFE